MSNKASIVKHVNYFIFIMLVVMVPLSYRVTYVDYYIKSFTNTDFSGWAHVLLSDSVVIFFIFFSIYISFFKGINSYVSLFVRALAVAVFLIYVIDFIVLLEFGFRFNTYDVVTYSSYMYKYVSQFDYVDLVYIIVSLSALLFISLFIVFSKYRIDDNFVHVPYALSSILLISPYAFSIEDRYTHSWMYKNVFSYNLSIYSEQRGYSDDFVKNFSFEDGVDCSFVDSDDRNVVILMVESLSSYQSDFFSGIKSWTSNIDAIAKEGISFKNFYANGYSTKDGEIAILTGLFPLYSPFSYESGVSLSFNGFYGVEDSLPNIFNREGYSTEFLTTADLEFSNTGSWAESIGFDYVEGSEHPYYEGWERFHFNAAPDEALYDRVFDRIDSNADGKYFLFIKTVTTHHPYVSPDGHKKSEQDVFLYSDKQIGLFYNKLVKSGFFDDGLLVMVGDHHSMIPLREEEVDSYGLDRAPAKVPAIILQGGGPIFVDEDEFQQTDIFNTLAGGVSGYQCHSSWSGLMFGGNRKPSEYIVHRRGDKRNMVSVFTSEDNYLVKLDGDNTRVVNGEAVDDSVKGLIVDKINSVRLTRNDNNLDVSRYENIQEL